jgi:hypothetical protein
MVVIKINTENAAFADAGYQEVIRILKNLTDKLENGKRPPIMLRDINGNTVGRCDIA